MLQLFRSPSIFPHPPTHFTSLLDVISCRFEWIAVVKDPHMWEKCANAKTWTCWSFERFRTWCTYRRHRQWLSSFGGSCKGFPPWRKHWSNQRKAQLLFTWTFSLDKGPHIAKLRRISAVVYSKRHSSASLGELLDIDELSQSYSQYEKVVLERYCNATHNADYRNVTSREKGRNSMSVNTNRTRIWTLVSINNTYVQK